MEESVKTAVADMIRRYGPAVCDDLRRCEGLLKDLCGPHPREIRVLSEALREGVPARLLQAAKSNEPLVLVIGRLSQHLDDLGNKTEDARWAVEVWASALGLSVPLAKPASAPPRRAQAPAPPNSGSAPGQRTRPQVPPPPAPVARPAPAHPLASPASAPGNASTPRLEGQRAHKAMPILVGLGAVGLIALAVGYSSRDEPSAAPASATMEARSPAHAVASPSAEEPREATDRPSPGSAGGEAAPDRPSTDDPVVRTPISVRPEPSPTVAPAVAVAHVAPPRPRVVERAPVSPSSQRLRDEARRTAREWLSGLGAGDYDAVGALLASDFTNENYTEAGVMNENYRRHEWLGRKRKRNYTSIQWEARSPLEVTLSGQDGLGRPLATVAYQQYVCLRRPGALYSSRGKERLDLRWRNDRWEVVREVFYRSASSGRACL